MQSELGSLGGLGDIPQVHRHHLFLYVGQLLSWAPRARRKRRGPARAAERTAGWCGADNDLACVLAEVVGREIGQFARILGRRDPRDGNSHARTGLEIIEELLALG
jgi:hypothetical protein